MLKIQNQPIYLVSLVNAPMIFGISERDAGAENCPSLNRSIQCLYAFFGTRLCTEEEYGGFHLHLLVFPFVCQFNSRIGVLVHSSFSNEKYRRISTTFQHHYKICLLWFLHEKECSFYTYLFNCTEMRWLFTSSTIYRFNYRFT